MTTQTSPANDPVRPLPLRWRYATRLLLTILSSIALVTTLALWIASYWPCGFLFFTSTTSWTVDLWEGTLMVEKETFSDPHPASGLVVGSAPFRPFRGLRTNFVPFFYSDPHRHLQLGLPLLYPALLFLVLPLLWLLPFHLRFLRRARNQCLRCGYNLTGNLSGICPECGNPTGATT